MSRRFLILGAVVVAVVVAIVLVAAGGDDDDIPAGSVATVDGEPITREDLDYWVNVIAASQQGPSAKKKPKPPKPGTVRYNELADQAMRFLVTARWVAGEAADRDLEVTDEEVKRQFEQTKEQSFPSEKAYDRFLRTSGQTERDVLYRVRLDVLSNKVRTDVTKDTAKVSDDDVETYYEQNEQQFSQPARRDIRQVRTKSEAKAQEALERLEAGDSFRDVAKKYSDDPATKDQGGRLLGVAEGQQEKALDEAIFSARRGQVTGPVETDQGFFYVFTVTKTTPATKQSVQQSRESIRQLLSSQKQQQSLDRFTVEFRRVWREKTDCVEQLVIPDCSNGKEEGVPGAGTKPPAISGLGTPFALGGSSTTAPQPGLQTGGQAGITQGGAQGPPAVSGAGSPPALGGAPAPPTALPGAPQGAPQQGAPQQAPPQQAPPQQGGSPQG